MVKKTDGGKSAETKSPSIHKAKDNSLKLILNDHGLFTEFLRDFIRIDALNGVEASDIEDVSERFLPLFDENRDSDTVKKIHLKEGYPLFVITIVEHESKVDFRSSYKMLKYITLILDTYEKEANKEKPGITSTKNFRYPPVLPIIFYDGKGQWTAERNFLNRTELNDVFAKYIPKFEYELVSLNEYSEEDLAKFGDTLSLVMLIDKIHDARGLRALGKLPSDYFEKLALNIPPHLNKLIADVIATLLRRVNVPNDEIVEVTDKIYERRVNKMFDWIEGYDVQETRRVARLEGERTGIFKGKREGKRERSLEIARNLKNKGMSVTEIVDITGLSAAEIESL
ncbi:MAG: Rpn family recombination-promoting nuclease/putative transposase [Clostridiales Family XIII bacterium]|jgi:predicted transposase/invertase (TIGR01784 family)|nr:Rpn family recombination-promoting nuclease/putative transposase [Clostridiales Family XIII bacterium]